MWGYILMSESRVYALGVYAGLFTTIGAPRIRHRCICGGIYCGLSPAYTPMVYTRGYLLLSELRVYALGVYAGLFTTIGAPRIRHRCICGGIYCGLSPAYTPMVYTRGYLLLSELRVYALGVYAGVHTAV